MKFCINFQPAFGPRLIFLDFLEVLFVFSNLVQIVDGGARDYTFINETVFICLPIHFRHLRLGQAFKPRLKEKVGPILIKQRRILKVQTDLKQKALILMVRY